MAAGTRLATSSQAVAQRISAGVADSRGLRLEEHHRIHLLLRLLQRGVVFRGEYEEGRDPIARDRRADTAAAGSAADELMIDACLARRGDRTHQPERRGIEPDAGKKPFRECARRGIVEARAGGVGLDVLLEREQASVEIEQRERLRLAAPQMHLPPACAGRCILSGLEKALVDESVDERKRTSAQPGFGRRLAHCRDGRVLVGDARVGRRQAAARQEEEEKCPRRAEPEQDPPVHSGRIAQVLFCEMPPFSEKARDTRTFKPRLSPGIEYGPRSVLLMLPPLSRCLRGDSRQAAATRQRTIADVRTS